MAEVVQSFLERLNWKNCNEQLEKYQSLSISWREALQALVRTLLRRTEWAMFADVLISVDNLLA
jgi:hypothetical protein